MHFQALDEFVKVLQQLIMGVGTWEVCEVNVDQESPLLVYEFEFDSEMGNMMCRNME